MVQLSPPAPPLPRDPRLANRYSAIPLTLAHVWANSSTEERGREDEVLEVAPRASLRCAERPGGRLSKMLNAPPRLGECGRTRLKPAPPVGNTLPRPTVQPRWTALERPTGKSDWGPRKLPTQEVSSFRDRGAHVLTNWRAKLAKSIALGPLA